MDSYEATRIVFQRIQSIDPENASKIMGVLLIQDCGEKEMIRLAFGPETLLQSLILKAKTQLGLSSNTSSATRTLNNGFSLPPSLTIPNNPSSPNSWSLSPSSTTSASLSYAAVVNGSNNTNTTTTNNNSNVSSSFSPSSSTSSTFPLYASASGGSDLVDDYHQFQNQIPFLNDPSSKHAELFYNNWADSMSESSSPLPIHRRSCSVNDICFGSDDSSSGFGWKPCLYFARGFCKNGSACRFVHGGCHDSNDVAAIVGSPSKFDGFEHCQEMFRAKAAQQQRLAAASQFLSSGVSPYQKCFNYLNENQRSAAAALMMAEEFHKFGRCRPERNDFASVGIGGSVSPSSRQIYLTFPADSTFREDDVSNYFSIYGPVQDVRIPYQQKRMFGFVTFVYPETVKLILAKGNPHFVCDSRVLVKPYKEKGKVPEKKQQQQQQQQLERGEFSACSSPSGHDSRDPYDLHLGARMLCNTQEMLLRRKLEEQADLQQAIELQERRLMNLQLLDLKNHHQPHHHHSLSPGSALPSPVQYQINPNPSLTLQNDGTRHEVAEENGVSQAAPISTIASTEQQLQKDGELASNYNNSNGKSDMKEESTKLDDCDLPEGLEHILPDNLFASPKKAAAADHHSVFSTALMDAEVSSTISITTSSSDNSLLLPTTSSVNMAPKSCYFQLPRFPSGPGTIG
ncbi:Zinc finger, CCCH-type, partial [Dillenia turbinata]